MELTKNELIKKLEHYRYLAGGSQGECYLDSREKIIYKIFHEFFQYSSNLSEQEIMQFSQIKNKTFIWPKELITTNNHLIGYTTLYKKASNLCNMSPLKINLDTLEKAIEIAGKDIEKITKQDVRIYDLMYNTLYDGKYLYIIDTIEYAHRKTNLWENRYPFDRELMYFLVEGYFNDFIENNHLLNNLYQDTKTSSIDFLKVFRMKLSEYIGHEIKTLEEAKKLVTPVQSKKYIRIIKNK